MVLFKHRLQRKTRLPENIEEKTEELTLVPNNNRKSQKNGEPAVVSSIINSLFAICLNGKHVHTKCMRHLTVHLIAMFMTG